MENNANIIMELSNTLLELTVKVNKAQTALDLITERFGQSRHEPNASEAYKAMNRTGDPRTANELFSIDWCESGHKFTMFLVESAIDQLAEVCSIATAKIEELDAQLERIKND